MVLPTPESSPADHESPTGGILPQGSPTDPGQPVIEMGRLLLFALVAAAFAGVVSVIAGEAIMDHYRSDLNPNIQNNPTPESVRLLKEARLYSAVFTFTTLGGLLGLALGLAGGLARRSVAASAGTAILGFLLGVVGSACASLLLVSFFYKNYDPVSSDLIFPLLTHTTIWSVMGALGGLAFGLGLGGSRRWPASLIGGLTGGAAAAVIYELVGALFFASSKTDLPLSASSTTRGMAIFLVAGLSAIGAVLAVCQPAKRKAKSRWPPDNPLSV